MDDRNIESVAAANDARLGGWDECWSDPIGEDHRSLRIAASDIRAVLAQLQRERDVAQELLQLLLAFRTRLFAHFEHEEATCVSSTACHQAGAPARKWLESVALDHLELRQRFDEVIASLERCVAAHGTPPASFCTALVACFDHLERHELSEARLFQIAHLWH